jgi:DNA mismatch repair ATPase MutL
MHLKNITLGFIQNCSYYERKKLVEFLVDCSHRIGLTAQDTNILEAKYFISAIIWLPHVVLDDLKNNVRHELNRSNDQEAIALYKSELEYWERVYKDIDLLGGNFKNSVSNSKKYTPPTRRRVRSTYINGTLVGQHYEDNSFTRDYSALDSAPPGGIGSLSDLGHLGKTCSQEFLSYFEKRRPMIYGNSHSAIRDRYKNQAKIIADAIETDEIFLKEASDFIQENANIFARTLKTPRAYHSPKKLTLLKNSYCDNLWAAFNMASELLEIIDDHSTAHRKTYEQVFPQFNLFSYCSESRDTLKEIRNKMRSYPESYWDKNIEELRSIILANQKDSSSSLKLPFDVNELHKSLGLIYNSFYPACRIIFKKYKNINVVSNFMLKEVKSKYEKVITKKNIGGGVVVDEIYDPVTGETKTRF